MKIDKMKLKSAIPIDTYFQDQLGPPAKTNRDHWVYFCPFHNDKNTPNLAVYFDGGFNCFACDAKGGDVLAFHQKRHGLSFPQVLTELAGKYAPELAPKYSKGQPQKILAEYPYRDESEKLLFQAVRYGRKKEFKQRKPDGNGGWVWNLKEIRCVPYRLPELLESKDTVFIPGGEKDCESLITHGLNATTNPMGEGNWRPEFNEFLKGRNVVILEDNDAAGQKHGRVVTDNLKGIAKSIRILRFEELPEHGDVTDFLKQNDKDDLLKRVEEAPLYKESYSEYFNDPDPEPDCKEERDDSFDDGSDDERPTQAKILVGLAGDAELFHDPDGNNYAGIPIDGHRENWRIRSRGFRNWLVRKFFETHEKPPGNQALSDALGVLEAKSQFEGEEYKTYVRLAEADNRIFLDLCNDEWGVVEIDGEGFRIVANSPVKFIRSKGMLPLPHPTNGGSIEELREFINIDSEESWVLLVGFLLASLSPCGPYPILILQGEQGCGKSTLARVIRELIDPSGASLRTLPRDVRDLMIAARNAWLMNFDNLSGLTDWMSDALCRISTGGGFATRELYSDAEEIIINVKRPQCLNGIDDLANRDDLRDRSVIVNLPVIPDNQRKDEKNFWQRFDDTCPRILGALLRVVGFAYANVHKTKLDSLPRMADFAKWMTAAEPALGWEPGTFMSAYSDNRAAAVELGIESSPVGQAVRNFVDETEDWMGTATDLLAKLDKCTTEKIRKSKAWPTTPRALSNRLRRLSPTLRAIGIDLDYEREGHTRRRLWTIRKVTYSSGPCVPDEENTDNSFEYNEMVGDDSGDDTGTKGTQGTSGHNSSSPDNSLNCKDQGDGDAGDANFPSCSKSGFPKDADPLRQGVI